VIVDTERPYLTFDEAAQFCCLSRARIEQLLRDSRIKFPRPFQPAGIGGRRCFSQQELVKWIERKRAAYPAKV
jgi:excisionase family DNA binding protein